jgi:proton-translocating NADH-quinone oxidoreductase chain N
MELTSLIGSIGLLLVAFVSVILLEFIGERKYVKEITVAGFILAFLPLLLLPGGTSELLRVDLFTIFFSVLFLAIGLLVVLSSKESTAVYDGSILLATIGMMLAAAANDLILLYISIELVTAPTYVLVAYGKTPKRMEAALKYFIVGIVASALLLLGIALLAATGTSTISSLTLSTNPLFLLGVAAFVAGLGFKLSIFPFNFWVPDVYEGAPAEVAALLAGASKKAAYAALLRVAVVLAALHTWSLMFAILAAITMTVPNIIALLQTNVRRLLAYSIMSHAGFLLIGVAIATQTGYSALLFHALMHGFMVLGAFLVLGIFSSHGFESIEQLKGLGWRNRFLGISLTLLLLSLAGIPLLGGFASKLYLFYTGIETGYFWLAALAILNSVIALYYYFKIIRALYAYNAAGHTFHVRPATLIAIWICLIIIIVAGVYPTPFIDFATAAASALF